MSEVIVRMGFHKNCLGCDLRQIVYGDSYADTDVYCSKENRFVGKRFGSTKDLARPDWCPIIGVLPEQHGDLIDRELLFRDIVELIITRKGTLSEVIEKQKAVIAAERKDDE